MHWIWEDLKKTIFVYKYYLPKLHLYFGKECLMMVNEP